MTLRHFPISKERHESNNSERNTEASVWEDISSYRHNGEWWEKVSQFNWNLAHEKQTEEKTNQADKAQDRPYWGGDLDPRGKF